MVEQWRWAPRSTESGGARFVETAHNPAANILALGPTNLSYRSDLRCCWLLMTSVNAAGLSQLNQILCTSTMKSDDALPPGYSVGTAAYLSGGAGYPCISPKMYLACTTGFLDLPTMALSVVLHDLRKKTRAADTDWLPWILIPSI